MPSISCIRSSVLRFGLLSAQDRGFSTLSRKDRLISLRSEVARSRIVPRALCAVPSLRGAVGQHQQVPVGTGTCAMLKLAVSKTKILLGVPEERLYAPSHRVRRDGMARWRINLFEMMYFTLSSSSPLLDSFVVIRSITSPSRLTSRFASRCGRFRRRSSVERCRCARLAYRLGFVHHRTRHVHRF